MDIMIFGASAENGLGKMCARGFCAQDQSHDIHYVARSPRSYPLIGTIRADKLRERFVREATAKEPDLILVLKGYHLSTDAIRAARKGADAVVVNWNPDNPFQVRSKSKTATRYLETLSAYDLVFTWGKFLIEQLKMHGAESVRLLPFGFDPHVHFPTDPVGEYECDVAFLGHWSRKREEFLAELTEFDFQLRGNMWKFKCLDWGLRGHYEGAALGIEEYARAMSSSDIVVNVVADHNKPAYNMRTFEVPATGSLMVTEQTAGQQQYFSDGEDVAMYSDPQDLRETVRYYVEHEQERETIARRGYETIQDHSYEQRMRQVLECVDEYR